MDKKPLTHTLTPTEARGGQMMNMTRWVLLFGLLLVIPGLLAIWYFVAP